MLAVTEVNRCRYCSFAHTKMALQSGLKSGEIRQILQHNVRDCPETEIQAILYAQHWAETDGHPEPEFRTNMEKQYDAELTDMIETVLLTMRMGNLIGNSLDYLLYKVSFGYLGN